MLTAKRRRTLPVPKITPDARVAQFSEDMYSDGTLLLCKFCHHSIDYVGIDTIKDHIKSKQFSFYY